MQEKIDQLLQAQAQFKQLLSAAAADTYEVWELREKWDAFQQQATALTASLGLWRGSLKSLGEIDMPSVLPDLADADAKLEQRFAAIEAMMENQAPVDTGPSLRAVKLLAATLDVARGAGCSFVNFFGTVARRRERVVALDNLVWREPDHDRQQGL